MGIQQIVDLLLKGLFLNDKLSSNINMYIEGKYKRDATLEEHYGIYGYHYWLKFQPFIVIG